MAHEFGQAREVLPAQATDIDDFRTRLDGILAAYMHNLEINANTEQRIRGELSAALGSKDKTIVTLQEREGKLKDEIEMARGLIEAGTREIEALRAQTEIAEEAAQKTEAALKDKDEINTMLTGKLAEAEKRAESVGALTEERDYLKEELTTALTKLTAREREYEMQTERTAHAAEKARNQAVEAVKAEKGQVIEELRERLSTSQIEAEKRIHELATAKAAEIRELEAKISALQIENARKDAEMERLKAEHK